MAKPTAANVTIPANPCTCILDKALGKDMCARCTYARDVREAIERLRSISLPPAFPSVYGRNHHTAALEHDARVERLGRATDALIAEYEAILKKMGA